MTDQCYYAVGKDKIGPLPESKIKELILNGQITLKDLLWKKGMTTWLRLEKVDEFAEFLNLKKDENTPPPWSKNLYREVANHQKSLYQC